jgi:hypothetical protein
VITNSTQSYDTPYPVSKIFDNDLSSFYISIRHEGGGVDTFIDFDFGAAKAIGGFMYRHTYYDQARPTAVELIFSNNADFSNPVATISWTGIPGYGTQVEDIPNGAYSTHSITFDSVTARYVKWDITQLLYADQDYVGASEMAFYVPEPATMLLLSLGALALRRRKA